LQDNVLEVFGADMFNMTVAQTTGFTKTWGGGALLGMLLLGIVSAIWAPSKKLLATLGGLGTALGLGILAIAALTTNPSLINPALLVMGFSTGCFNVGALAMMMDMTIEGSRGLYMGLWGMAQAFGTGLAAALSGGLHTVLIGQLQLAPSLAYLLIFGGEAVLMIVSIGLLRTVSVPAFRGATPATIGEALALEAA
ncbi:MAG: PucC family protein, partial [Chloroflexales bacterium]|nr:PucC family protein [Chloroflexales bacterium]